MADILATKKETTALNRLLVYLCYLYEFAEHSFETIGSK